MQGLAPEHDTPVTYRKKINIPSSWSGSKIILRFDGTYSYATLLINGKEIRKHRGGFTRWDTDVTPFIKPGRTNEVELQLTDPVDEISYASGYAHHPVGGILRSVGMFTQPESFISDLKADASLDSTYTDGRIDVRFSHDRMDGKRTQVEVAVIDSDGSTVRSEAKPVMEGLNSIALDVEQPKRWDAEHPNLYTLRLEFKTEGKPTATVEKQIGFRNIEVDGNRLLVNGRPVKLRGACRHDIHPTLGRSSDRTTDSIDARLFIPDPLIPDLGFGIKLANKPCRLAIVFTASLNVIILSAASSASLYLKSISCWAGADSWYDASISNPISSNASTISRLAFSPKSTGPSSK